MAKKRLRIILLFFLIFSFFVKINTISSTIVEFCYPVLKMIPYKACVVGVVLLYGIREFPHLNAPKFTDGKCYSEFGTNSDFYVLHLHGWGINAHADTFTKQSPEDVYIVSPRFSETINRKIFSSCFGQEFDAFVAIQAIRETHHVATAINTVAHCRGATVFFTVISILSNSNHPILKKIGIEEKERLEILEKFKRGCSIIISPLLGVDFFLYHWFRNPLGVIIHKIFFPWLTQYEYNPQGGGIIRCLSEWNTPISLSVLLPEYDNFIGTDFRKEFLELLLKKNGQKYTKVCILKNEKKHWPLVLRSMSYKELFIRFGFLINNNFKMQHNECLYFSK